MLEEIVRVFEQRLQESLHGARDLLLVFLGGTLVELLVKSAAMCPPGLAVLHERDVPAPASTVNVFSLGKQREGSEILQLMDHDGVRSVEGELTTLVML